MTNSKVSIQRHDKGVYYQQIEAATAVMSAGQWTLRQKMALACRIVAADGQGGGIAGQISARLEDSTFWTQTFELEFEEAKARDCRRQRQSQPGRSFSQLHLSAAAGHLCHRSYPCPAGHGAFDDWRTSRPFVHGKPS